jgi:hypothetical protein
MYPHNVMSEIRKALIWSCLHSTSITEVKTIELKQWAFANKEKERYLLYPHTEIKKNRIGTSRLSAGMGHAPIEFYYLLKYENIVAS